MSGNEYDETSPLLLPGDDRGGNHWEHNQHKKLAESSEEVIAQSEPIVKESLFLAATYLLQYLYSYVVIIVAGQLGTEALAAISLGTVTMNITGYGILEGISSSLDTLCAQAYGSGNKKLVGLHVQRVILLQLLVTVGIGVFWGFSPRILGTIVPQEELRTTAGSFLMISLIGIPGYAVFEAGKRFAQAQGNFTAALAVLVLYSPIHLFLVWLFVFHFDYGVMGAAFANAVSTSIRPIALVLYLRIQAPETIKCWPSFSWRAALRNWGPIIYLSVPGAAITLCEWVSFEILTLSSARISTTALAAQTLLSSAGMLIWHLPFASSVVVTTRLGTMIGAGAIKPARRAAYRYVSFFVGLGVLDSMLVLIIIKGIVARYFIQDPEVRRIAESALVSVAAFQFLDSVTCCMTGIVRALGRQAWAGWATFFVNYGLSVPLSLYLELGVPKLGLTGLWAGQGAGMALLILVHITIVTSRDWRYAVADARKRDEVVISD